MMIVDKNLITKYVCKPSGLSFYVVDSSKSGKYFCLPDSYCSCTNFIYSTALKQEGLIVSFKKITFISVNIFWQLKW